MIGTKASASAALVITAALLAPASARGQNPPPDIECSECKTCILRPDWFMFELVITASNPDLWEGDFTDWGCFELNCSEPPTPCDDYSDDDPEQSLRLLAVATADMKPDERRALRSRLKGKAVFVAERSAVQVIGCRGVVIAHLPVTSERAATLEKLTRASSTLPSAATAAPRKVGL